MYPRFFVSSSVYPNFFPPARLELQWNSGVSNLLFVQTNYENKKRIISSQLFVYKQWRKVNLW
jgi:hypothetical protein